uniref:Uncharacterized protein n=1 Tax=Syphacia muris TaxID=451379 RepID=A0A0N5ADT2_9BILA
MFAMDDIDERVPSIVVAKPPTVSDFASTLSSVIATASSQHTDTIDEPVRAGFDADVVWRPPRLSRSRTCSLESADSEYCRSISVTENNSPTEEPKGRRFSISELFGSPNRFSASVPTQSPIRECTESFVRRVRLPSVTEDERFKAILRNQKRNGGTKQY